MFKILRKKSPEPKPPVMDPAPVPAAVSEPVPEGPASPAPEPVNGSPPVPAVASRPTKDQIEEARKYISNMKLEGNAIVDDDGTFTAVNGTLLPYLQSIQNLLKAGGLHPEIVYVEPLDFRRKASLTTQRPKSGSQKAKDVLEANLTVDSVLNRAIEMNASDFYLDIRDDGEIAVLSMRTYGIVVEIDRFTNDQGKEIARGLYTKSGRDSWEEINPCDTSFSHYNQGKLYRVRANSVPEIRGASLSCRVRDPSFVLDLETAGYSPLQKEHIQRICRTPGGLILVTGETNSGKSTTLASLMKDTPRGQRMIEIADPVEVEFDNVTHCEIDHKRKDPKEFFLRLLSSTVRQNPDALVLGEVRDPETASAAQNMAIQGKRVFTTLHTQSCVASIPRIINLGVDAHLVTLPEFIAGIVNQNLVPVVCPDCFRKEASDEGLRERYRKLFGDQARYVNPEGCGPDNPKCIRGIVGQTLVAEVYPLGLDRKMAHQIIAAGELWKLPEYMAEEFGVQSKQDHARDKVLAGTIDPELTEAIIGEWKDPDVKTFSPAPSSPSTPNRPSNGSRGGRRSGKRRKGRGRHA